MVQAWYMDESAADPRRPHHAQPRRPVGLEQLRRLGVLYWKVPASRARPGARGRGAEVARAPAHTPKLGREGTAAETGPGRGAHAQWRRVVGGPLAVRRLGRGAGGGGGESAV